MANPAIAVTATTTRSIRWPVVSLLTAGVIIAYVDRINLSSAVPEIRKSFSLSAGDAGLLLSAFFWSYTILQVPAGWIVDRWGIRKPYAIAFLLWSGVSAATSLVNSLIGLVLVRILLGIGESIVTPASMRYLRMNFPEKERGLAVGIYMSGTKLGPAIGAPIAAYLIQGFGWRTMFIVLGIGCLLWLVPWLTLVPREADLKSGLSATAAASGPVSWRRILLSPVIWGTCFATFAYMYFVYFCMTWMPTYFKERHGLSLTDSGWFTAASFGGMAAIGIAGGWMADRLIARGRNPVNVRKGFAVAGLLLAMTEAAGAFTTSYNFTLFLAVFSLSGLGLTMANYWALTQTLMPASAAGRVAGIQNTAANLAGAVAAWLSGILVQKTGNFNAPLIAIGVVLAVGITCYIVLVREKYAVR